MVCGGVINNRCAPWPRDIVAVASATPAATNPGAKKKKINPEILEPKFSRALFLVGKLQAIGGGGASLNLV